MNEELKRIAIEYRDTVDGLYQHGNFEDAFKALELADKHYQTLVDNGYIIPITLFEEEARIQ